MKLQRAFNRGFALGVLSDDDGHVFFTTFEDKPIPAGKYTAKLLPHPIHGVCWEVVNVPGRTGILFHVGNDASDSEGCILVGYGFAGPTITDSFIAFARFTRFLRRLAQFTLIISDPCTPAASVTTPSA